MCCAASALAWPCRCSTRWCPPRRVFARDLVAPKRFGAVFVPHGERPGFWTPEKVGANFEPSTILKPLTPYRDQLTVVSQLSNPVAGHGVSVASWLSGTIPKRTVAEDVHAGRTIDQIIADKIGRDTVFKSLEVATEDFSGYIGGCDPAYACAYMNTLSWKSETRTTADGDQSAQPFRAHVRSPGHGRAETRAHAHGSQHSRFGERRSRAADALGQPSGPFAAE